MKKTLGMKSPVGMTMRGQSSMLARGEVLYQD
jgi:hypothetical protein